MKVEPGLVLCDGPCGDMERQCNSGGESAGCAAANDLSGLVSSATSRRPHWAPPMRQQRSEVGAFGEEFPVEQRIVLAFQK